MADIRKREYSKKEDWPTVVYELPRAHRITIEDLDLRGRFGVTSDLPQLREASYLDGPLGKKAQEAMNFLKAWFLGLMEHDGGLDNDFETCKARGVESTPPHYLFKRVEDDFDSLVAYLIFLDYSKMGKSLPPHIKEDHVKNVRESHVCLEAQSWFKRWLSERGDKKVKQNAEDLVKTMTLPAINGLTHAEARTLCKDLEINAKGSGPELRERLAVHYGLLEGIVSNN